MENEEQWKELDEYPGYLISDQGRIATIRDPSTGPRGYVQANVQVDGKTVGKKAHQLVAEAFLPDPPGPIGRGLDDFQVHHCNGDKSDNRAENLAYVRKSDHFVLTKENDQYPKGDGHENARLTKSEVAEIRILYRTGDYTQRELGEKFGVSQGAISSIVTGQTWKHVDGDRTRVGTSEAHSSTDGRTKLTPEDVREMRERYHGDEEDVSMRTLAEEYGVTTDTARAAIRRETWKHVD